MSSAVIAGSNCDYQRQVSPLKNQQISIFTGTGTATVIAITPSPMLLNSNKRERVWERNPIGEQSECV